MPTRVVSDLDVAEHISRTYEKVVHCRKNLLKVLFCKTGGSFVDEIAGLIKGFAEGLPFERLHGKQSLLLASCGFKNQILQD